MIGEAAGLPDACITFNPATAPDKACAGLENIPTAICSSFTDEIELVSLERSWGSPVPRNNDFIQYLGIFL